MGRFFDQIRSFDIEIVLLWVSSHILLMKRYYKYYTFETVQTEHSSNKTTKQKEEDDMVEDTAVLGQFVRR